MVQKSIGRGKGSGRAARAARAAGRLSGSAGLEMLDGPMAVELAEVKPRAGLGAAIVARPSPVVAALAQPAMEFGPQHVFENRARRGLGWLRDTPDVRDMTLKQVAPTLEAIAEVQKGHKQVSGKIMAAADAALPAAVDNRRFCSRIEDQEQLGSCTANACVGLVEYMERRASGQHTDGSRLFVYKTTRKLLGWQGDTGAFLRTTMKALVNFGVPPEEFWPYEIAGFDREPDPFLYAFAANTKAIRYMRLDPATATRAQVLDNIRGAVAKGYAVMFGFSVYTSLSASPDIPYPSPTDRLEGGHAVLIVGYDDNHQNVGSASGGNGKGALLIRNSWGAGWGDRGYGWLPYDYVRTGLADDFWTCFKMSWIESGQFG